MTDKPTLNDVVKLLDSAYLDWSAYAAAVREAQSVLERCENYIRATTPTPELPRDLIADIRRLLGAKNE